LKEGMRCIYYNNGRGAVMIIFWYTRRRERGG